MNKDNPYSTPYARDAWEEGWHEGRKSVWVGSTDKEQYEKGKSHAADEFIERLILLAQEYGSDRFVFTAHNMTELEESHNELGRILGDIATLR